MLDTTLVFLKNQLDSYLGTRYSSSEPHVVLAGLCNLDGTVPADIENKVVLSLVNIEREAAAGATGPHLRPENGGFARMSPALNLNLYLLVSAPFKSTVSTDSSYEGALKLLSAVLGYFQGKPVFTAQNAPAFPRGLDKLTVEIVNLDFLGLHNLWGNNGGKYLPSVLYKARMFTLQEGWILEQVPSITGTDTTTM
jgi:hypothetical protein